MPDGLSSSICRPGSNLPPHLTRCIGQWTATRGARMPRTLTSQDRSGSLEPRRTIYNPLVTRALVTLWHLDGFPAKSLTWMLFLLDPMGASYAFAPLGWQGITSARVIRGLRLALGKVYVDIGQFSVAARGSSVARLNNAATAALPTQIGGDIANLAGGTVARRHRQLVRKRLVDGAAAAHFGGCYPSSHGYAFQQFERDGWSANTATDGQVICWIRIIRYAAPQQSPCSPYRVL